MDENGFLKFSEAKIGDTFERPVFVAVINESIAKTGSTFVRMTLKDGFTEVVANMFATDKNTLAENGVKEGTVISAKINVSEFRGAKSFRVDTASPCTDERFPVSSFVKTPPLDADVMFDEIIAMLKSSENTYDGKYTPLCDLAVAILTHFKERFKTSSAAVSMHHNMKSGLIYHTYRMVKTADAVCGIYGDLDRELLLCATALHDIGKIHEYNTNEFGEAEFTSQGVLLGHLYMGASIIRNYSTKGNYNPEKVLLLIHMILSHHGTMEFGAVKPPAFAEAFVLFYIDNLDAKIGTCENHYEGLEPGEMTDKKPFGLDNRIYRPKL